MGGLELVTVAEDFSIEFMEKRERELGIDIGRRRFWNDVAYRIDKQEMTTEVVSLLVDLIFKTLYTYDERRSRNAVDNVIVKALRVDSFMKSFAATVVQGMEKQIKFQSHVGCYRLVKWSSLLLSKSQFPSISKNALCRVASAQASVIHIVKMQGSLRELRDCKKTIYSLFSESPQIYKTYIEELKESRIPYKDSPELLSFVLEYSRSNSSYFDQWKAVFLDMYVRVILNVKEKPSDGLSEAFRSLFSYLSHEEFKSIVVPSSVKMLKRSPELVLGSINALLKSVNLDLSKYALEILSVVLPQARHADEGRRLVALSIIKCLSEKSSNPDAIEAMFNAIKSVIGGSEGRLAFPYQRVGMVTALQELSSAVEGKYLNKISPNICNFLLSCYKDDGNEDVKLASLSALASWAARSAAVIQPDLLSFMASGLKEKEALRRGHLRCILGVTKNIDAILTLTSLVGPLLLLVKTGFAKAVQRLDGIYALLIISKIAALDIKTEDTIAQERVWSLVSQNEPSVVPISMALKLSVEDCLACLELVEVLLVDHSQRVLETLSDKSLSQLIIFFLCHSCWDIRKVAQNSLKKILAASPQLGEALVVEYLSYLSVVEEKVVLTKRSETETSLDTQVPFVPSVEVMVKALLVMAPEVLAANPSTFLRIILCSHHPCLVGTAKGNAVWKRLQKCLQTLSFDVIDLIMADLGKICKGLVGPFGLMSSNHLEQEAAIHSLSTLMSITPTDTYTEFEKHLNNLPDRFEHDKLSENDIQIYLTPEGMLSTEQGVYIAEFVTGNNQKQAKGRFRVYENDNGSDKATTHPVKRESSTVGKKDGTKSTKKAEKGKTAKEEARELQLSEEACVRNRVMSIQNTLSLMLKALGEMAISNPVFAHSQLSTLVKFVNPLLRSPIVGDAAYKTMIMLAKCSVAPLNNWALDLATALRLIATDESHHLCNIIPSDGEIMPKGGPFLGLFERIITGLSVSCKTGPLPVDSFTFVFPIMERTLLSSKKTALHDDVLKILFLHMDPILPLPRLRMITVLYHVLGVIPAYQASIGPALNELCLGLQTDEVAPALDGIYAKDIHVRLACLNAVKCIPAVTSRSLPRSVEVATSIWIALHDVEKPVAEVAEDIWDRYGYEFGKDYSGLFKALSHVNYNVRMSAAEALAAVLDENPDTIQESLSTLFSLYIRDVGFGEDNIDAGWLGRQGTALALLSVADVLRTKDLPVVMTFLISRALADSNADVRGRMLNAGIMIIDKHGKDNVSLLFPIFENYLNKKASNEEKYDLVREGVVIFTGALAKHLGKVMFFLSMLSHKLTMIVEFSIYTYFVEQDDPKVHAVVEKLLDVINTPSEAVQRAVSACLSPLMQSKQVCVSGALKMLLKYRRYLVYLDECVYFGHNVYNNIHRLLRLWTRSFCVLLHAMLRCFLTDLHSSII